MNHRNIEAVLGKIATFAILTLCLSAAPLIAQQNPEAAKLAALAAGLSRQYDTTVLLDPALAGVSRPIFSRREIPLETALDALSRQLPHAVWRKVYFTAEARPDQAAKLAAAARTLDRISLTSLILENTVTRRATTVDKEVIVSSPAFGARLQAGHFRTKPLYLIYSTTAAGDGKTQEERFKDLEKEMLALLATVPEQKSAVM
jgi:hypothetical protein